MERDVTNDCSSPAESQRPGFYTMTAVGHEARLSRLNSSAILPDIGAETITDYRCVGGTKLIGHGDVYICFGIVIRHIRLLVQLRWLLLTAGWRSVVRRF